VYSRLFFPPSHWHLLAPPRIALTSLSSTPQDYPFSELSRWVFQSVKPDSKNDISFSEYVHMVSAFIMLGPKDLAKFLFQCADTDGRQYLT
jgi:hypothetical protein